MDRIVPTTNGYYYNGDINPYLTVVHSTGWECPKCYRVYSPQTPMCFYCPSKTTFASTTTTANIKPFTDGSKKKAK